MTHIWFKAAKVERQSLCHSCSVGLPRDGVTSLLCSPCSLCTHMFPPLLLFLYKFHLSASCSLQCVLALNDAAHVQSWAGPGFLSVKSHGNLATSDGSEVQGQISHTWPWLGLVEPWGLVYYKWRACLNLLLLFTYTELPNSTASFDLTGVQAGLGPCGSSSASQVLGLPVCTSGWPPTSVFSIS